MNKPNTQQAKEFGKTAFAEGIINAPWSDYRFQSMISGRQVGDARTVIEMKAWIAGWTESNLSAN